MANAKNSDISLEARLWRAADALRGSMDAAEYKHVVLGLIFLKYISDAFETHRAKLEAEQYADPEDADEYRAHNIFWVPAEARWARLQANARQPTIGQIIDEAMAAIEKHNPALKDVLPKDYARPALDKARLGQLIDLLSDLQIGGESAARPVRPEMSSARSTNTFSRSLLAPRARRAASSTPRAAWSSCWLR
jgi:type I restriction enzyme M protein